MIASVAFRNFKALRNASLALGPFNLVIGPNGSGKTSLIQALLRLRMLAKLPLRGPDGDEVRTIAEGPEVRFRFSPPFEALAAEISCVSDTQCDLLRVTPFPDHEDRHDWAELRGRLLEVRSYCFDHQTMIGRVPVENADLAESGSNLAAVVRRLALQAPAAFAGLRAELCRILPEYEDVGFVVGNDGLVEVTLRMAGEKTEVRADNLSQGTLYLLAILALAFDPAPAPLICFEEIDRGFHPRLLREVRDALYRLSHPSATGMARGPAQVIVTTHSPYLLDLFRDHPEEVVISEKQGTAARFSRLADRPDLAELLAEGTLGDMWFTGLLGGVPEETL